MLIFLNSCNLSLNSRDEQCKKIIRAINRREASYNISFAEALNPPKIQTSFQDPTTEASPKVQRFNSRKTTGKSIQELQREEEKVLKDSFTKQIEDVYKESDKQLKKINDQSLAHLDAMVKDIRAVELSDLQLKKLQAQLAKAYEQNRYDTSASNSLQQYSKIWSNSDKLPTDQEIKKQQDDSLKESQKSQDAYLRVKKSTSDLNKYCELE